MKLPTADSSFDEIVHFLGLNGKNICDKFVERYCNGEEYNKYYIEVECSQYAIQYFVIYNQYTHNEFGPSRLFFSLETRKIRHISYTIENLRHRIGLPSVIEFGGDGTVVYEAYNLHRLFHNSVAPAVRIFSDGKWDNKFYIKGKYLSRDKFFQHYMKV
jgi:hypothetical protein